jgi:hypothetical protein
MVNKQTIIISAILILAAIGVLFFSNMTGNVITGAAIDPEINIKYFKIDDFGSEVNVSPSRDDFASPEIKIINKQEE